MRQSALHRHSLGALRSATGPRDTASRLRIGVWFASLLLAAELVYVAVTSPRLAVREIVVRGDPAITRLVTGAVRLPPNTNLLRAPTHAVERQAESVSAVRDAHVERRLPGRLVINVERREAAAVVRLPDRAVLIDPDGVPFTVPGEWGWGLPELAPPEVATATTTSGRSGAGVLLEALRLLGSDPRLRPARLELAAPGHVEVRLQSGPRVNLGDPDELGAKLDLLITALAKLGAGNIEYLDLADPDSAYWRPRDAAALTPLR